MLFLLASCWAKEGEQEEEKEDIKDHYTLMMMAMVSQVCVYYLIYHSVLTKR